MPLYEKYMCQYKPQDAYVQIYDDGDIEYASDSEIGGGLPADVVHKVHVRIYGISPYLSRHGVHQLHNEIKDRLDDIIAGHSVEHDGSNYVGILTDDAADAVESIEALFELNDTWGWDDYDKEGGDEEVAQGDGTQHTQTVSLCGLSPATAMETLAES